MDKYNNKLLGKRIKDIRTSRKETLEKFAKNIQEKADFKIKTTKSNVSKWEKGLNTPNDVTLKAIAELGNTTVEYLLYGSLDEYINSLLEDFKNELIANDTVSNALVPLIVDDIKETFLSKIQGRKVSDGKNLELLFNECKKDSIERWSSAEKIETNVLELISKSLSRTIQNSMEYLYTDFYKNEDSKIKSSNKITDLSNLKMDTLHLLDKYQAALIDELRYNDKNRIQLRIKELKDLIDSLPTIHL